MSSKITRLQANIQKRFWRDEAYLKYPLWWQFWPRFKAVRKFRRLNKLVVAGKAIEYNICLKWEDNKKDDMQATLDDLSFRLSQSYRADVYMKEMGTESSECSFDKLNSINLKIHIQLHQEVQTDLPNNVHQLFK